MALKIVAVLLKVGLIGMNDLQGGALIAEFRSRLNDYGIMLSETVTFEPRDSDDVIDNRLQKVWNDLCFEAWITAKALNVCKTLRLRLHEAGRIFGRPNILPLSLPVYTRPA